MLGIIEELVYDHKTSVYHTLEAPCKDIHDLVKMPVFDAIWGSTKWMTKHSIKCYFGDSMKSAFHKTVQRHRSLQYHLIASVVGGGIRTGLFRAIALRYSPKSGFTPLQKSTLMFREFG